MTKEQAIVYLRFSGFSDEQIKAIEGAFSGWGSCDPVSEKAEGSEDCISSSENPSKWIPVSERLPNIADVYRVTRYYPNNVMNPKYLVDACFFDGSNTWYNDNRINHERAYADNVIAWQENPEPYKAEGSEE